MPSAVWLILAAPLVGSFLGVLIIRLPSGKPIIWSRSVCESCGQQLKAFDLVPIASSIALRRRCRYCGGTISALYPIIEIAAVLIAVWAASVTSGWQLWASCGLGWALLALGAIDLRDRILPDALTLPLLIAGMAFSFLLGRAELLGSVIGVVAGFLCFAGVRWLYRLLRGREGMGLGDAKLLAAAGAWVHWEGLPSVVLIGAILALAMALVAAFRGGRLTAETSLAFGPGLCAGLWLVWLYGPLGSFR